MNSNQHVCDVLSYTPKHSLVIITPQVGKQFSILLDSYDESSQCIKGLHNNFPMQFSCCCVLGIQVLPPEYLPCFEEDECKCTSDFTVNTAGIEQDLFYEFTKFLNKRVTITLVDKNNHTIQGIIRFVGEDFVEIQTPVAKPNTFMILSFSKIVSVSHVKQKLSVGA